MASFIRPEAAKALMRWREVLIGCLAAMGGLYLSLTGIGVQQYFGLALTVGAALMIFAGIQRVRFRLGQGGPGIVKLDERQVSYFGPLEGGFVDLDELVELTLDPTSKPANWVLTQPGQQPLHIPTTAEGADALFDAFAALPELNTERMLAELERSPDQPVVIWQRPDTVQSVTLH